ncbi:MAG: universal stress protein [Actinomycetota bacterium]
MMKILYATDGGEPAIAALSLLEKSARKDAVEIVVLSVAAGPTHSEEDDARRADETVNRAVERLVSAGFKADGRMTRGHPAAEIVAEAGRGAFDLILMGAGNKRWLDRLLLGSQSTRVLHNAQCSVFIVHEAPPEEDRTRILVGADGSADSRISVDILCRMADPEACEATVLAVAQVPFPTFAGGPGVAYATTAYTKEIERELTASAQSYAEDAASRLRSAGLDTVAKWVLGSAAIRLLEEAEKSSADLVVVGSRGLGPVDRWVMGSVSDKMARHARASLVARHQHA